MVFAAILDVVSDYAESAASGYLSSRPLLSAAIRVGLDEGRTATSILQEFRAAGGRIANQKFWQVTRSIKATQNAYQFVSQALAGDTSAVSPLEGGRAGSYRYDWKVHQAFTDEDGNVIIRDQQFTSGSREFNVREAMKNFIDIYNQNIADQEYGGTLLGLELTGVFEYTGE